MSRLRCPDCNVFLRKIDSDTHECPKCKDRFGQEDDLLDTAIDIGIGLALGSLFSSSSDDDSSDSGSSFSSDDFSGGGGDSGGAGSSGDW